MHTGTCGCLQSQLEEVLTTLMTGDAPAAQLGPDGTPLCFAVGSGVFWSGRLLLSPGLAAVSLTAVTHAIGYTGRLDLHADSRSTQGQVAVYLPQDFSSGECD